jgi:REP element-mobilizing transposase RayT
MQYDPEIHRRRSIRLRGYDYSQAGAYYVTVCTRGKVHLFGQVVEGEMALNDAGRMVRSAWEHMPRQFPTFELDGYVVMPNHFHAVIRIVGAPLVGAPNRAGTRPAPTVGDIVGAFKSITTDEFLRGVRESGWSPLNGALWQRNYYEHIIRDDDELNKIREYVATNPVRWDTDLENPDYVRDT